MNSVSSQDELRQSSEDVNLIADLSELAKLSNELESDIPTPDFDARASKLFFADKSSYSLYDYEEDENSIENRLRKATEEKTRINDWFNIASALFFLIPFILVHVFGIFSENKSITLIFIVVSMMVFVTGLVLMVSQLWNCFDNAYSDLIADFDAAIKTITDTLDVQNALQGLDHLFLARPRWMLLSRYRNKLFVWQQLFPHHLHTSLFFLVPADVILFFYTKDEAASSVGITLYIFGLITLFAFPMSVVMGTRSKKWPNFERFDARPALLSGHYKLLAYIAQLSKRGG